MRMKIFSVLDTKSGAFAQPFFAFNAAVAQRSLRAALQDPQSLLGKFPGDYQLFEVGVFDDGSGVIEGIVPVAICNVSSLVERT